MAYTFKQKANKKATTKFVKFDNDFFEQVALYDDVDVFELMIQYTEDMIKLDKEAEDAKNIRE